MLKILAYILAFISVGSLAVISIRRNLKGETSFWHKTGFIAASKIVLDPFDIRIAIIGGVSLLTLLALWLFLL